MIGSWGTEGPFSTVFGYPSWTPTWGPFDPMFPNETLLSDGKVDAGDAPMPAARIDVNIVDNDPANKTDISGVGYLDPADKAAIYSRDGTGAGTAHNLYAPYYSQYIPATSRPPLDDVYPSGIEGAAAAGFNGYLVERALQELGLRMAAQLPSERRLGVPRVPELPALGKSQGVPPAAVRLQLGLGLHR